MDTKNIIPPGPGAADEELDAKTVFYEAQINSAIDGILVVDPHDRKIFQNQRMVDLFKIPQSLADDRDDMKLRRWVMGLTKYPEQFIERVSYMYSHPAETSRDEMELKDGTILDRYSSPIIGEDGEYHGRIWTFRDISESKRTEKALREADEKFRQFANHITDVFWITSPDFGAIEYVSPGYELIWGRSAEGLYANPRQWAEAVLPPERGRVAAVFATLTENEPKVSVEYRIARPDGTIRWVYDRGFQVRDHDGKLIRLIGIATDVTERKEAEIATRRLASIVEFSNDAIIGKDLHGMVTSWNAAAERTLGYLASEMVGEPISRLIPAGRRQEEADIMAKIRQGQSVKRFETVRLRKDGKALDVSVTVSPIKDSAGLVVGASKVVREITERKRAEQALIASEMRYRRLFESAKDGILILDAESGVVMEVNPFLIGLLGYSHELFLGKKIWELGFFKDIVGNQDHFAQLQKEQYIRYEDRPLETSDGRRIDVEFVSNVYLVDKRKVIQCNIRDITERKRTDSRVRLQSAALEAAANTIVITDIKGVILWANHAFTALTGYSLEEAIGKNLGILKSGKHDEAFYRNLWKTIFAGNVWNGEIINRRKDGTFYTEEMTITPIRDQRGAVTHFIAVKHDITGRKLLESQFLRTQRMESIGTLAGGIAHDLNNGLAPILMAVEVLKDQVTEAGGRRLLALVAASTEHCSALVSQVLSFARGIEGETVIVNLVHLLNEIRNIVNDTFPKNIDFVASWSPGVWTVMGDATHLHQVLINLCVNARDAMPNGGTLTVTVENIELDDVYAGMNPESRPGVYVMVKVQDTGNGIPPVIRDRIFEPFFTTKEPGNGTGLGLSTTIGIIKKYGGFIDLSSEIGKGTVFRVYLPANTTVKAVEEAAIENAALPRGNGETVLLVDDEERIRTVAQQTLERFGYQVLVAANGAEAVALYARHPGQIAVVFTDMAMPVMDGPSTIIALRTLDPSVKIVGSSGVASDAGKAARADVKYFVPKPYTTKAILNILAKAIGEEV